MIEAFLTSFKLKNAYQTNAIIYSLKSIPVIKKLLPISLYGNSGLKKFANIVSILWELIWLFLGKLLYLLLMIFFLTAPMKSESANSFVHIFFFLTVVGGLLNTQIFNPTKDKYYAILLMRMSAREYTLSNYFYFLLKMVVGFLPFTLLFGLLSGTHIVICLVMPLFVVFVKLIFTALALHHYARTDYAKNENLPAPIVWGGVGVSLVAAYLPPFLGYAMNEVLFLTLFAAATVGAVFSFWYVLKFREYRSIYKRLLTTDRFAINRKDMAAQAVQKSYQKKMECDSDIIDLFPQHVLIDTLYKHVQHKCIPMIPNIDIGRIIKSCDGCTVNDVEQERNKLLSDFVFINK